MAVLRGGPININGSNERVYFVAKIVDSIDILPSPYKEWEDKVLLRVTEKEIEGAFPK